MKLSTIPLLLATTLLAPLTSATSSTLDLYAWPISSSSKPASFAQITYDAATRIASVSKYTVPSSISAPYSSKPEDRVRVGFYDKQTSAWTGIVTSAATFDPSLQQRIQVHLSADGQAYHVDFGAVQKARAAGGGGEQVIVELLAPGVPPSPVLNKPVVLDPSGKVAGGPEEKSFFQKYWWVIAGFLLLQAVMGGGKE